MEQLAPPPRRYTVDEYLRMERDAAQKHEYRNGEIIAMAGGSVNHSLIIANCLRSIGNRLDGTPCRVFDSNLRVRITRKMLYSYPDATVICGSPKIDPDDSAGETILNPRLVLEVLSKSTESYDRTEKFDRYRQIESFEEYVLVLQDSPRIESYSRRPDGTWIFDVASGRAAVSKLHSLDIALPLAEVYAGIEFPPEPTRDGK
jgi:Uma2 family endonuclease